MRALALAVLAVWSGAVEAADFRILSASDVERYRRLFELEKENRWAESDALRRKLKNPVLVGHVLYQRYIVSPDYVTPYEELEAWLEAYGDHPGAYRVSRLAHKRRPPGARPPAPERHPPVRKPTPLFTEKPLRKPTTAFGAIYARRIKRNLAERRPDLAARRLRSAAVRRALGQDYADKLRADTAFAFYLRGKDAEAYQFASKRAAAASHRISLLHWVAGLAAVRLGWDAVAARHFAAHSISPAASPWNASAGAFWAARLYRKLEREDEAGQWLRKAAQHKRTFYGMLARETLGLPHGLNFEPPPVDEAVRRRVRAEPAAVRALALAQVGRSVVAEWEMRRALADADADTTRALLAACLLNQRPSGSWPGSGSRSREHWQAATGCGTTFPCPLPPRSSWQHPAGQCGSIISFRRGHAPTVPDPEVRIPYSRQRALPAETATRQCLLPANAQAREFPGHCLQSRPQNCHPWCTS